MKDINILIFGDSIAYGAFDDENAGWVNRLRLALENNNDTCYNIYNLGISGDTTLGVIKRFYYECDNRCNSDAKNVIIFAIGINDSQIINKKNNVDQEIFRNNIIDLINMAKKYTNNILFIGLTKVDESKTVPISWNTNISYFNKKILDFDKELENVCAEYNVNYLKIFDLLEKEELDDGIHPNSQGHKKISEEVLKKLKNII